MKVLSVLTALQGLGYVYNSIFNLSHSNIFKYVQFLMSPYYHLTGIILGSLLFITGIGMWFRKRYSYYLTIVLYSVLIINGLVGIVLMMMAKEIVPLILIIFILTLFFIIIRYTQKNRTLFK